METYRCSRCGEGRTEEFFYPSRWKARAKHGAWCKDCHRSYYRQRRQQNPAPFWARQRTLRNKKRKLVESIKVERGCERCGERHPACLEFHHRDPAEKDDNLAKMVDKNRPVKALLAEIEKCEVLCSNCHRKEHWKE